MPAGNEKITATELAELRKKGAEYDELKAENDKLKAENDELKKKMDIKSPSKGPYRKDEDK